MGFPRPPEIYHVQEVEISPIFIRSLVRSVRKTVFSKRCQFFKLFMFIAVCKACVFAMFKQHCKIPCNCALSVSHCLSVYLGRVLCMTACFCASAVYNLISSEIHMYISPAIVSSVLEYCVEVYGHHVCAI